MEQGEEEQIGLFWPDQVFKDTVVLSIVIFILLTLSVYYPALLPGLLIRPIQLIC